MADDKGFVAKYFSDGTYDAYTNFRPPTGSSADDGKESEPVWGYLLPDEPIKGTWDSTDGFFQLVKDGQRNYVGSVKFEAPISGGYAPSSWTAGTKAQEFQLEDGNIAATGPAEFRGLGYKGAPGGRLQAI